MRRSHAFLFVLVALLVSPVWAQQQAQSIEPVPTWLAWKAFYDSLDFYGKRTPKQDVQIVTEKFGLIEAQASSLLSAGQSFLAEIQRIDQDARVEAKKRYQYVTPQTGPPPAGGPTRRASAQPKTIYERAQADGLYAEVEAKKQAALTKHINSIRLSLSSAKMDQISQFVETSVKPQISRYAGPKPTAKGQPRPATGLTETPLKVR